MTQKFLLLTLGIALLAVMGYLASMQLATPPSPVLVMPGASNVTVKNYKLGRVEGVLTTFTAPVSPDAVHAFYRTALPRMGWPYIDPNSTGSYNHLKVNSTASALELPETSFSLYGNGPGEFGVPNSAALIVSQAEEITYVRVFSYFGRINEPSIIVP